MFKNLLKKRILKDPLAFSEKKIANAVVKGIVTMHELRKAGAFTPLREQKVVELIKKIMMGGDSLSDISQESSVEAEKTANTLNTSSSDSISRLSQTTILDDFSENTFVPHDRFVLDDQDKPADLSGDSSYWQQMLE